ncbi:MAG: SCO family protein [Alphaproteobacteria bacterium]|nr:SCO family protein [Alphaproteobacteria bacterium]
MKFLAITQRLLSAALAVVLVAAVGEPASAHKGVDHSKPREETTGTESNTRLPTADTNVPQPVYEYKPSEAGSYKLPRIKEASNGKVLFEDSSKGTLVDLFGRRQVTIMAFVYTRCGDVCPIASNQMAMLHEALNGMPELEGKVALASVSFDPEYDTPAVMREYGSHFKSAPAKYVPWHFISPISVEEGNKIVQAYDQPVGRDKNNSAVLHHILRAFLVDGKHQVRNIYSIDFLDPSLLIADIKTILAEQHAGVIGQGGH